jgi:prevent-host-death family protein
MFIDSKKLQNNFDKYLDLASDQEIIITQNGLPVARLVGMKASISYLSERLVGLVPKNVNEELVRDERLERQ